MLNVLLFSSLLVERDSHSTAMSKIILLYNFACICESLSNELHISTREKEKKMIEAHSYVLFRRKTMYLHITYSNSNIRLHAIKRKLITYTLLQFNCPFTCGITRNSCVVKFSPLYLSGLIFSFHYLVC